MMIDTVAIFITGSLLAGCFVACLRLGALVVLWL